jgi:NAD(P)H-hydrate epimerase
MQEITELPELPPRPDESHKGTFGKVLIIAGSLGMTGAAALSGRAALRCGSGLVRVAAPKSLLPVIAAMEPCFTTIPLAENDGHIATEAMHDLLPHLSDNDAVAVGPGLGQTRGARDVVNALIAQQALKLVVDADGLNVLAQIPDWSTQRKASVVLTPHPGEMRRLWQRDFREEIPSDRIQTAVQYAQQCGCIVVLKGAGTVVTDGKAYYVNPTGNWGMATAGSGDVLTGMIVSLIGRGMIPLDAAVLGVYLHGLAGDLGAEALHPVSMIATDIIELLPDAFCEYENPDMDEDYFEG